MRRFVPRDRTLDVLPYLLPGERCEVHLLESVLGLPTRAPNGAAGLRRHLLVARQELSPARDDHSFEFGAGGHELVDSRPVILDRACVFVERVEQSYGVALSIDGFELAHGASLPKGNQDQSKLFASTSPPIAFV